MGGKRLIRGIGVDIVDLARIEAVVERFGQRFVQRILTEREIALLSNPVPLHSLAGRFASKEAVAKALGSGIAGFSWHDIEVLRHENGDPWVQLHRGAKAIAQQRGVSKVWVSLSHERTHAVASAVAEG